MIYHTFYHEVHCSMKCMLIRVQQLIEWYKMRYIRLIWTLKSNALQSQYTLNKFRMNAENLGRAKRLQKLINF